ncbi:ABC transporter substrate-binding protein [Streptomyces sp. SID8366]|uniref:ABC transporter substrate-binding protein n=2 Tax=Streptomyces TaxID=1883 RepID=UPI000DB9D85B|nr:ABC transporter substrate-binding protein [Streptomyces sp. PsTaAH-130]MYU02644.1 ABC transporter substrate-binding protein [Streptomyces sp. SID8366]RAJ55546.1 iron complex transport system substrate-binding protein [Streptomyces sp. PsTaAH-130]
MTSVPSPARASARRGSARPRLLRPAVAAAALALALTACGSSSTTTGGGDGKAAATRVVGTAHGKVTVPAHPLRIVSVHSWSTESLLDLGIRPVGVENSGANYVPPRYLKRWKAAAKVTTGADIDYEKIAALKPDLIVGVDVPYLSKAYKRLSAIAPTAFASFDESSSWSTYPQATATFVNGTAQLARLKRKYDDRIAAVRTSLGTKLTDSSWDVIQGGFDSGNYWIYSPASPVGDILSRLGVRFASATASVGKGGTKSVSYERADLLKDADYVVYYTNNDGSPANDIQKLFALRTFKELPAAKKHRVVGTPDFLPGSYSDAMGVVDSIEKGLRGQSG